MKKFLAIMLLLCPLSMSCAKSQQTEKQLLESQNNLTEMEHRLANLEQRLETIDNTVQEGSSRVYDVRNKAGRPTGWTAHPKNEPKPSTMPPVAHVSPITDAKKAPVPPVPAPVTPVAQAPITPAPVTPVAPASATQAQPVARAPLGALDPSSRLGGVEVKQNEPNPSPALSLPPESPMYPPAEGVPSTPIVPPVNTNAQVATLPPNHVQQAVVQPIPAAPPVAQAKPVKAVSGEQGAYKTALDLVLAGNFAQGREKFNAFLQQYPNGRLAPNAYYWIGESFYAQKNYPEALLSFKQVTSSYPKHHKTPDALLKAGMTYEMLGDKDNARLQYQALLADFPSSSAAKIARNKKP